MGTTHDEPARAAQAPSPAGGAAATDRTSGPATSPAQADRITNAAATWKLAAPPRIELGETIVGQRATHGTSIFAVGPAQGPRVRASVTGDPAIRLLAAPLYLPDAGAPYSPSNEFKFEHRPIRKGEAHGTLELAITDAPQETFRYPVMAAAHHPGDPTLAEEAAAEPEAAQERADADARKAARDHATAEGERDLDRKTSPHWASVRT
ncbi:MAG: hypothetical protein M3680_26450 [Myxococcota bacterium]|nr:hypothetical protein [Myxococcota bacterium]